MGANPPRSERGVIALVEVDPALQVAWLGDLRPPSAARGVAFILSDPGELNSVSVKAAVDAALNGDHLEVTETVGVERDVSWCNEVERVLVSHLRLNDAPLADELLRGVQSSSPRWEVASSSTQSSSVQLIPFRPGTFLFAPAL